MLLISQKEPINQSVLQYGQRGWRCSRYLVEDMTKENHCHMILFHLVQQVLLYFLFFNCTLKCKLVLKWRCLVGVERLLICRETGDRNIWDQSVVYCLALFFFVLVCFFPLQFSQNQPWSAWRIFSHCKCIIHMSTVLCVEGLNECVLAAFLHDSDSRWNNTFLVCSCHMA